jgi:hypothetical protein
MEELTAMFRVCNAIKNDGVRCGSPALTGINFCWQHMGGKVPSTRAKATTSANAKLKLAYPKDRQAIQHNLFLVAQALNDGKIDTATANTFNRIYRTCELNLRQWEKAHDGDMLPLPDETVVNNDVILSEANGESGVEGPAFSQPLSNNDVILSEARGADEAEGPAFRQSEEINEENPVESENGAQRTVAGQDPYADLRHLPPTEFARRVFERVEQRAPKPPLAIR